MWSLHTLEAVHGRSLDLALAMSRSTKFDSATVHLSSSHTQAPPSSSYVAVGYKHEYHYLVGDPRY